MSENPSVLNNIRKKNISIMRKMTTVAYHMKRQEYLYALRYVNQVLELFQEEVAEILQEKEFFNQMEAFVDDMALVSMLQGLITALESKDYILLQDLLELQLQPFLTKMQESFAMQFPVFVDEEKLQENVQTLYQYAPDAGCIAGIFSAGDIGSGQRNAEGVSDVNGEGGLLGGDKLNAACECVRNAVEKLLKERYLIEYTSCGEYTLALQRRENTAGKEGGFHYYHSNGNVEEEALQLAHSWFETGKYTYGVIGLGLGYPIRALLEMDEAITVTVAETDKNILYLACAFGDIANLLSGGRCKIVIDESLEVVNREGKEREWCVQYPAIDNIAREDLRIQIEDYFINKSSMKTQRIRLDGNFEKNSKHNLKSVDELAEIFRGKDLYIIAAGPSLDNNIDELKKVGENGIILATGTVMKKLLNKGIPVDYGILIDAGVATFRQIEGIENCGVPILVLSTAHYKIVSEYQGERYLICQEGYSPAEEFAGKHKYELYQSGGSVSTTALELGIRFGCKRIIFVGLDLAYSGGKYHASDTEFDREMSEGNTRYVEDIHGGKVLTGKNLDIYRKWIEDRIAEETGGIFIDATEGGAKIKGCKIQKLSEVI
ncbi:MAG: motility associated factor glycosyltransferase family protein [Lachnospiraceae bacterium]|nr:motility associated factor glycosyltransferase family protein [Lachnospiraceae bacterium]